MRRALVVLLLLVCGTAQADTLRCGSKLVSIGDRAFEVERKCGAPNQRADVGYTLDALARVERKLDEWIYGPRNGMLQILTFEGNRLVRIESRRAD